MIENDIFYYNIKKNEQIMFKLCRKEDPLKEITQLLHRSYKFLLDMGLKFLATSQSEEITQERINDAYKCYVGVYNNKIVATICLYSPESCDESRWYNKKNVAKFGQFAVCPELQKYGIGSKMIEIVEQEARNIQNVTELALDTAETAYHLISYYNKRGYEYKETISWGTTNYNSVILSKHLYK